MKCRATLGLPVLRAHPQLVGRDGADLRDLQHRAQRRAQRADGADRRLGVVGAPRGYSDWISSPLLGREAHAEVRQAVRPRPGTPSCGVQLTGIEAEDRVAVDRRRDGAEELVALLLGRVGDAALDPDLVDRLAPAGEDADAVAAGR